MLPLLSSLSFLKFRRASRLDVTLTYLVATERESATELCVEAFAPATKAGVPQVAFINVNSNANTPPSVGARVGVDVGTAVGVEVLCISKLVSIAAQEEK